MSDFYSAPTTDNSAPATTSYSAPDNSYAAPAATSYSAPSSDPTPSTHHASTGQTNHHSGATTDNANPYTTSSSTNDAGLPSTQPEPNNGNTSDTRNPYSSSHQHPVGQGPPPPDCNQTAIPSIVEQPVIAPQPVSEKTPAITAAPIATAQPNFSSPGAFDNQGPPTKFQAGLCDCWGDCKLCLCACCCTSCLFNRTSAVMDHTHTPEMSLEDAEREWLGINCVGYYLLAAWTGCGQIIWQGHRRGLLRRKYNIQGSSGKDYLLSCCCTPCALGQEDIEVRRIERERLLQFQTGQQTLAQQNL